MVAEEFDDERLTAMGLFVEIYGGLTARLDAVHAARDLAGTDFDTLIRLARSPDQRLRMSDLAAQTALSTSGITRVIDRLEHRGLVSRQACPRDRRSALAVLTQDGHALLLAHVPAVVEAIDAALTACLTPTQLAALLQALHIVRDAVRPTAISGATPTGRPPSQVSTC